MCRKTALFFTISFCLLTTHLSAQISGTVFWDFDRNGTQSASEPVETGVGAMQVLAYVEGQSQPLSVSTTSNGRFTFGSDQIQPGKRVRIELGERPLYCFDSPGMGSSVQFVQAPNTSVLFGLSDPVDYCQADPMFVVPLFQTGTLSGASSGLISFPSTALTTYTADVPPPAQRATNSEVGSVWATAYQRDSKQLFALSLLKRHAALGPLGLGGIYLTTPDATNASSYIDAGTYLTLASEADKATLATRTLPSSFSTTSVDGAVFAMIGKVGLGGAAFTPAQDQLWTINLHEKKLVSIRLGLPARSPDQIGADAFTSYDIPQRDTDKGTNRPWAVTYHLGKLYVGIVNDASTSRQRTDLKAYVYAFDLITKTFAQDPVLIVPLDYTKGWAVRGADDAASLGNRWEPWSDTWSDFSTNVLNGSSSPQLHRVVRPQPILSSIGFDSEGAMILGFMDRTGHQTSRNQPAPTETGTPSVLYSGYGGGDILRAALISGTYVLESNGSVGSHSGSGVANNQGPSDGIAGGEFYQWEQYAPESPTNTAIANQETFTGSLLTNPNLNGLVTTVYNPLATWSGGASLFDMFNGDIVRRYEIYRDNLSTVPTAPRSTFGSTNGVGMLSALCDEAPVEIGNRLWVDTNGDGVQDPAEPALGGVCLSLYNTDGRWVASTRTNEQGRYSFRSGLSLRLAYNTTYYVVIGMDLVHRQYDQVRRILRVGNKAYKITGWNQGVGVNESFKSLNDSDAFILTGTSSAIDGYPVMQFRLNVPGEVLNSLDAGMQETCDPSTATCLPIAWQRVK